MRIVLLEPEIHFNTGNIGRTCVATATELHLVGKLGFSLDAKQVRRSGLDYWAKLKLRVHEDWPRFEGSLKKDARLLFFSTKAKPLFWDASFHEDSYLVFGSESKGLPQDLRERFKEYFYKIPVNGEVRSLNLSTAAGIVLYEALRQTSADWEPGVTANIARAS